LYLIGVDVAKEKVYSRLRVERPGPGYCHFPLDRGRDWFEMLVSERIVVERGIRKFAKPAGVRNEALDARAYALAALHSLYMAGFKLDAHAAAFAEKRETSPSPAARPPARQVIRSSWMGSAMAYSQQQLEALEAALASGMLRVSFQGRSVEYRSVEELKKAIAEVKAALAAADPARPNSRVVRIYTTKGF